MIELSQYRLETLHQDGEFILYRGVRSTTAETSPPSILALSPVMEHPGPATIKKLEQEFSLKDELGPTWAVRPIALTQHHSRTMLLCEDAEGEPLDRLVRRPMEVQPFLRCAIGLAAALGQVHRRGLIHKEIKPSNVLANGALDHVWLRGFGIASRLPRERQRADSPEFIAGTLAYMAPEQTGRMNRSIDSRSDLYALGVLLYELVTGSLPFTASEPMDWIHCHVARQPLTPTARRGDVPHVLSAIVMKLLAKAPEARYQTAAGVERDLRRCLHDWDRHGSLPDFPPGEHDISDRLVIPEALYGREREVETLLAAFDRIVHGGVAELVLVSGYSGIGKSSVVNELQPVLVPPRGLFASGKFDQYKRDIPYSTLAQAFQSLVRSLLTKSETELGPWRRDLREALDQNGQLIVDLVPELKLVIGDQPPVPDVPAQDGQRRFQLVFRRFISVFARPEHPLALFLDDLQWLDAATLDLLEDLLTRSELEHVMLIGAYRDNEVDAAHPLMRKLEAIKSAGGTVHEITLGPLDPEHLGRLLADTLRCEPERTVPLTQLVHEKTGGNPFFTIQFISSLADEDMLAFDHDAACWSWDLDRIHAKGYTDNVADLMIAKLARLPAQTRRAVEQLACLGHVADITTLSTVLEMSPEQGHAALWESVRQGLVERVDDSYRFIHDRVQEAAYSLIPEASRMEAHVRIGRLMTAHTSAEKREETVFDIVNQLNRGVMLITARQERDNLAELNLIAGRRAKASSAYASALTYLTTAAALLDDHAWETRRELAFAVELGRAECEFLTGELQPADERLTRLSNRTATTIERAELTSLFLDVCLERLQLDRAIAAALDYFRQVGIEWSPHPTEEEVRREYEQIWSHLGDRTIEELADLPPMTDAESLATMDVLLKSGLPAAFWDDNLNCLIVCRAVNLSLARGNCDASCVVYCSLGWVAIRHFRDYKTAFRFGQAGLGLIEERGLRRFEARARAFFGDFVAPWMNHVRVAIDVMRRAFDAASRIGDFTFVNYANFKISTHLLFAGAPLSEVQREAQLGLAFGQKARATGDVVAIPRLGLIRTLRGLTPSFGSLDGQEMDELRFERLLAGNPHLRIHECWYWIRKMMARYFAGDYTAAMDASSKAQRLVSFTIPQIEEAEYHFYSALSRAASYDSATADERQQHVAALAAHHRQFEMWAENCPENFENRAALVGAEIACIESRELEAMRLYEQAIHSSRTHGFVNNEALAYERASAFYRARGFDQFADTYLRHARACYARWGADGKVRQLDQLYPGLGLDPPLPGRTATFTAPVEGLDLATVIRVSQAVSSEIVLDRLVDTVMRHALEHAGADRGLLLLQQGDQLHVKAEATTDGTDVAVRAVDGAMSPAAVPESLLRYVVRTHEPVILDDASGRDAFAGDEYFRERHPRSVACLPLLKQARLVAVLYLENALASHVFTTTRLELLEVLASQAAIALENTRLYRDVEQREGEIRALKDQLYRENLALRDEVDRASMFEEIVGASAALKTVLSRVAKVAPTESTVFISGETGTGKELVARAVHKRSRRSTRAFVSVNCAALAPTLIASELFGYEKGAFTGAMQRRLGRFELADGGTIFLDEVGELLPDTQVALLRVLQEREFERVGGAQPIRVDVRVIAATNRDLTAAIANGSFRQDLFYRLNVFPIEVPPLRARKSDLVVLVEYFVQRYASRAGKRIHSIDKKTLDLLQAYDWPGNIRELQNVIERSVVLTPGEVFVVDELWLSTQTPTPPPTPQLPVSTSSHGEARSERAMIEVALAQSRGRVAGPSGAAAKLNTPASTLEHRIRALRIDKSRFKFR